MKFCAAQIRLVKGDIPANIIRHKKFIELAVSNGGDVIFFPELSLTGYEPQLAENLATDKDDKRFDVFQKISNERNIVIGISVPTKTNTGNCISMVIFQPNQAPKTYSKKYIHADEEPYFIPGDSLSIIDVQNTRIAPAICYELSIPEHSQNAFNNGAQIYLASVAKTADGVNNAYKRLSQIASTYSVPVLMSNCVGPCDNFQSAGGSAVWDKNGLLLAHFNEIDEGILIFETDKNQVIKKLYK